MGAAILIYRTLRVQCTLRVHACCLLHCLSLTWMAPFCYGLYCGGRHFDLAPLGCSAPSGCRLVYCTVYRSHGWRHFVMVCIVGAAILIVFAPLGAVHPQGACLLFNVLFIAHMGAAILI